MLQSSLPEWIASCDSRVARTVVTSSSGKAEKQRSGRAGSRCQKGARAETERKEEKKQEQRATRRALTCSFWMSKPAGLLQ